MYHYFEINQFFLFILRGIDIARGEGSGYATENRSAIWT